MRRHPVKGQDGGPFRAKADEHWIQTIFAGVLLFLATVSNAQETTLLKKPRIDTLGSPPFFAKISSISPSLDIYNNSPSSLERTQLAARFPITYFEFRPGFNRLHGSGAFVRSPATIAELLNNDKTWKGGMPIYDGTDPYGKAHQKGMEQYIRRVPMAGPILGRICRHAKAHPNLTRALSMFRPDF